jgi:hypothetical protein
MNFDEWWDTYPTPGGEDYVAAKAAWDAAIDAAAAALDAREEEAASAHTMVPEILALKSNRAAQ